jgi:hypothetical protein
MVSLIPGKECRSRSRYKLDLELQFSYRRFGRTWRGTGRTRDFGDKAVCFECDQALPRGVALELSIDWTAGPQGFYPLEMIVRGKLARQRKNLAVLLMDTFEFRTRGDVSFSARATRGTVCDLLA